MSTDTNVNGGTKLLTAGLLMTLGVGGALLFRQDPSDSPRNSSMRSEPAANELLVRRSNVPGAAAFEHPVLPRAPQPSDMPPIGGSGGMAQFSGSIDPFRNEGSRAATQGRLTADYGRPATPPGIPGVPAPTSMSQYAPSYLFVDPTSEAERTPLNNVTPRIELPPEYPGLHSREGLSAGSYPIVPSNSATSSSVGLTPIGSAPSRSANPTASIQSPFVNTKTARTGDVASVPRTVMPTLHAGSGTSAAPPQFDTPPTEPARPKNAASRRHKVRDGDTLASLAADYYGDAARSEAIFAANREVLSSPDVLTIGTYLVIPSAEEAAAATAAAAANPPPAARLLPRVQIRPLGE